MIRTDTICHRKPTSRPRVELRRVEATVGNRATANIDTQHKIYGVDSYQLDIHTPYGVPQSHRYSY